MSFKQPRQQSGDSKNADVMNLHLTDEETAALLKELARGFSSSRLFGLSERDDLSVDHKNHAIDLYNDADASTKADISAKARAQDHHGIAHWIRTHPRTTAVGGFTGVNFLGLAIYLGKKLV